jgi:hypothetical protein
MKNQQSFKGTVGSGQTDLAGGLREPQKPWAYTVGFFLGISTMPIVIAFSEYGSGLPALVFFCVWLGAGFWIWRNYRTKLEVWQAYLATHFICLRCGTTFRPNTIGGQESSQFTAELDQARNRRVG